MKSKATTTATTVATTKKAPIKQKNAFLKVEVKHAKKLMCELEDTLHKLSSLSESIGNNEYLMRTGIDMSAVIKSEPLASGKVKISVAIKVVVPAKNNS